MPPRNAEIVDPAGWADWDAGVAESAACSVFHSAAWARLLSGTYGYEPLYLVCREGKRLAYCLPVMQVRSALTGTRGVSLPFSDFCRPLGTWPGNPETGTALDFCLRVGKARRWRYVEFRGDVFAGQPPPAAAFYFEHTLDLSAGAEVLFAKARGSVRQAIRKGHRFGLQTTLDNSTESLEAFCRLNRLTRREHGLPPQPTAFFRNLHDWILSRGMGHVVVARHADRPVAAAVFLHFGGRALFKYGASDRTRQHLRGNACVLWDAIRWYAAHGYARLSLGRTSPADSGLRRFKLNWNPMEERCGYFRYSFSAGGFLGAVPPAGGFREWIMRRLPLGVAQALGNAVYRHAG